MASPQPSQLSNNSLNHHHPNLSTPGSGGNGGGCPTGGGGYHSPSQQLHDQQLLVPHPQLTPGGNDDGGVSSDCSDDEGSPQNPDHMPVVYPWMKKIHVGGSKFTSSSPWLATWTLPYKSRTLETFKLPFNFKIEAPNLVLNILWPSLGKSHRYV